MDEVIALLNNLNERLSVQLDHFECHQPEWKAANRAQHDMLLAQLEDLEEVIEIVVDHLCRRLEHSSVAYAPIAGRPLLHSIN